MTDHHAYGDWRSLELAIKDAAKKAARDAGPGISAATVDAQIRQARSTGGRPPPSYSKASLPATVPLSPQRRRRPGPRRPLRSCTTPPLGTRTQLRSPLARRHPFRGGVAFGMGSVPCRPLPPSLVARRRDCRGPSLVGMDGEVRRRPHRGAQARTGRLATRDRRRRGRANDGRPVATRRPRGGVPPQPHQPDQRPVRRSHQRLGRPHHRVRRQTRRADRRAGETSRPAHPQGVDAERILDLAASRKPLPVDHPTAALAYRVKDLATPRKQHRAAASIDPFSRPSQQQSGPSLGL